MFISFEGADGSGKTTQAKLLVQSLNQQGIKAVYTKEPGGTKIGQQIRKIIFNEDIDSMCELLLLLADRRMHIKEFILPNIKDGIWVISDRFSDSSLCYQGILKNLGIEKVDKLQKQLLQDVQPNITFLLDLSIDITRARLLNRHDNNYYDNMSADLHVKVRNGFLFLAQQFADRIKIIDANQDPRELHNSILHHPSLIDLMHAKRSKY